MGGGFGGGSSSVETLFTATAAKGVLQLQGKTFRGQVLNIELFRNLGNRIGNTKLL